MRVLGSGGMGTVYLAEDTAIGQQVAIKVVRTDDADYPDATTMMRAAERFRYEARAVASLDHLHILPLYRYDEEETTSGLRAYIIMQYRPEGSLWDWLRRRAGLSSNESLVAAPRLPLHVPASWPLSVDEAGEYLRQAASALQYAHDHRIVHRDVKPANFLLRFDNNSLEADEKKVSLLLSDFGLAKFFSSNSATSHIFGTPTYMAPEQFDGAALPESDQYALAVMIYYFLAGRPPFEGDPMQLMHRHLSVEPPPIRSFVPTLSAGIESVLARALAKQPQERFPSVMAFASAFTQQMREVSRPVSPPLLLPTRPAEAPQRLSDYMPTIKPIQPVGENNAASSGTLSAPTPFMPYNAPTFQAVPPSQPVFHPQTTPAPASQPVSNPLPAFPPSVVQASNQATVYPMPLTATPSQGFPAAQSWPSSQLPVHPSFPPPQSPLAPVQPMPMQEPRVSRRSALGWLVGGAAIAVVGVGVYFYTKHNVPTVKYILKGHTAGVTSVSWSPDGTRLASTSLDHTMRLWAASNQQNILTARYNASVQTVAWRPDGSLLASGGEDRAVQVWTPTGARRDTFANIGASVSSVVWEKHGLRLFVGTLGGGIHVLTLNSRASTVLLQKTSTHTLALSPDGLTLAVGNTNGTITLLSFANLRNSQVVNTRFGVVLSLAWSADGTMLAVGSSDRQAHIVNVQSKTVISLAHDDVVNGVAWETTGNGNPRLATVASDGIVRIWSTDGSLVSSYHGQAGVLTSVAWSANGLAIGAANATILVLDA